jgi:hypothetical protein
MNDVAIFHQVIAGVAGRLRALRGEPRENNLSIKHHSMAMRTVSNKLSDAKEAQRDYALAGVAILVCYSVSMLLYILCESCLLTEYL